MHNYESEDFKREYSAFFCEKHKKNKIFFIKEKGYFACEDDFDDLRNKICSYFDIFIENKSEILKLKQINASEIHQNLAKSVFSNGFKDCLDNLLAETTNFGKYLEKLVDFTQNSSEVIFPELNEEYNIIKNSIRNVNINDNGGITFVSYGKELFNELKILRLANFLINQKNKIKETNIGNYMIKKENFNINEFVDEFQKIFINLGKASYLLLTTAVEDINNENKNKKTDLEITNKVKLKKEILFKEEIDHILKQNSDEIKEKNLIIEELTRKIEMLTISNKIALDNSNEISNLNENSFNDSNNSDVPLRKFNLMKLSKSNQEYLKNLVNTLKLSLDQKVKSFNELKAQKKEIQDQNKTLQEKLEKFESDLHQIRGEYENLFSKQYIEHKSKLQRLETDIFNEKNRNFSLQREHDKMKIELESLKNFNTDMKSISSMSSDPDGQTKILKVKYCDKIIQLEAEKSTMFKEIEEQNLNKEMMLIEIKSLLNQNELLYAKIEELELHLNTRIDSMTSNLVQNTKSSEYFKLQFENVIYEKESLEKELIQKSSKLNQFESENRILRVKYEASLMEINSLHEKLKAGLIMQENIVDLEKEHGKLIEANIDLQTKNCSKDNQIIQLKQQLEYMKIKVEKLTILISKSNHSSNNVSPLKNDSKLLSKIEFDALKKKIDGNNFKDSEKSRFIIPEKLNLKKENLNKVENVLQDFSNKVISSNNSPQLSPMNSKRNLSPRNVNIFMKMIIDSFNKIDDQVRNELKKITIKSPRLKGLLKNIQKKEEKNRINLSGLEFIDVSQIHLNYQLLSEEYGEVWLAEKRDYYKRVEILMVKPDLSAQMLEKLQKEIDIMKLNSPFAKKILGYFQKDDKLSFINEYYGGENLEKLVKQNKIHSLKIKFKIIMQILEAVKYFHCQKIIHSNLTSANILFPNVILSEHSDFQIIILNFKDFKVISENQEKIGQQTNLLNKSINKISDADDELNLCTFYYGNIQYSAPEILIGEENSIDFKSDIFSIGNIVWEIFSGRIPYDDLNLTEQQILMKRMRENIKPNLDHLAINTPKEIRNFLVQSWEYECINRPSIDEAIEILKNIMMNST